MKIASRIAGILCILSYVLLTACGGGGGGSNGTPPVGVTPSLPVANTPAPPSQSAPASVADCPTSGAVAAAAIGAAPMAVRRTAPTVQAARAVPGELAVTYTGSHAAAAIRAALQASVQARSIHTVDLGALGIREHIVTVDPAKTQTAMAALRQTPGIQSVVPVAYRQRMSTPNDPYYVGALGAPAPYYETAGTPGQWDMHVLKLGQAWSSVTAGAPIAVIDTGADLKHPELGGGKVVRTRCFVTYPSGTAQTTGTFVTDTNGHGTDVAGIADDDTNNAFGFAGTAYNAPLMIYRIFPSDPSGGCDGTNPPAQCDSNTVDEASAINDAVAHGAKVINLSLGGDSSGTCATNDPEYTAVEAAIKSGVVVVAASGNGNAQRVGQPYLDCPGADPGVIAVGASALNDSGTTIKEDVASYSNYLSASNGRYLVAPGGDPCPGAGSTCNDSDDLHWIENIYSTTAQTAVGGSCAGGVDNFNETGDCNVLIAGTSMATPHVAGIVSLMLGANPSLSPAQIAQGLCASADNIGDSKQGCGRVDAAGAVSWAKTH